MAKTANIYARVESELKEQAEQVLDQVGLPMSNAITLFLRQIVLQRGLPFEVQLPQTMLLNWGAMTAEAQNTALETGYQQMQSGAGIPAEQVFAELEQKYGL